MENCHPMAEISTVDSYNTWQHSTEHYRMINSAAELPPSTTCYILSSAASVHAHFFNTPSMLYVCMYVNQLVSKSLSASAGFLPFRSLRPCIPSSIT